MIPDAVQPCPGNEKKEKNQDNKETAKGRKDRGKTGGQRRKAVHGRKEGEKNPAEQMGGKTVPQKPGPGFAPPEPIAP
jgi:hypothetical protein